MACKTRNFTPLPTHDSTLSSFWLSNFLARPEVFLHVEMCRFVIYKGTSPVQLSHVGPNPLNSRISSKWTWQLLTRPCHSIINQAFDCRLRVDRRRPINGDGFGVGWYDSVFDEELGSQPCIFTSVTPVSRPYVATWCHMLTCDQAWNNINLTRIAEKIKSPLVL